VVTRTTVEGCAEHHGVAMERARAEIRLLVATAVSRGAWRRSRQGFWMIDFMGMNSVLLPAGTVVISYKTRHYERLPSEVISGLPSRFGKRSTDRQDRGLSLPQILERVQDPCFSDRLVTSWTGRFGDGRELRQQFLAALSEGAWERDSTPGTWVLRAGECCFAVRDNGTVVAAWPNPTVLIDIAS
jgi:hypothetical protein